MSKLYMYVLVLFLQSLGELLLSLWFVRSVRVHKCHATYNVGGNSWQMNTVPIILH